MSCRPTVGSSLVSGLTMKSRSLPYLADKEKSRSEAVTNILIIVLASAAFALALLYDARGSGLNSLRCLRRHGRRRSSRLGLASRTREHQARLLERIAGRLGFQYRGAMDRPDYYEQFRTLKSLPCHNRDEWEDEISGGHAGAKFLICEAHLK